MGKVIAKATIISSGNKLETNDDIPVPFPQGSKQSAADILLSQKSSQHYWGHPRGNLHCSILQNYVFPNPRSPSKDVGQETEASNINLDRSTDNPKPNYARGCLATPSKSIWIHQSTLTSLNYSEHQAISM
jgi:hypothetical protein